MTEETPTPAPQPFPFTLRVRDWLRGRGGVENTSLLLDEDGLQCCMGQLAEQCGVPRERLRDLAVISQLSSDIPHELAWAVEGIPTQRATTQEAYRVYQWNDYALTTDEQKIETLTRLFAEHGIEMTVDRESTKR